jgi:hypothetical protein
MHALVEDTQTELARHILAATFNVEIVGSIRDATAQRRVGDTAES